MDYSTLRRQFFVLLRQSKRHNKANKSDGLVIWLSGD
jgi:hypothetical protein